MVSRSLFALGLATLGLALFPAVSPAPVPPKDCGFIKVGSKRFNVKGDQLPCKTVRAWSRTIIKGDGRPKGYSCKTYKPSETAIRFRCTKGSRTFFAIRR